MDIIDILMARAMTPQGQIESYAARAEQAVNAAMEAVNNIATITEQTNANNVAAQEALENVEAALNELDTVGNLQDIADNEISKLAFAVNTVNSNNAITNNLKITYPDDEQTNVAVTKYYTTTGNNIDGTMTQKAITQAMKSATVNLGANNANHIVAINNDGSLRPSAITEQDLINGDIHIDPQPQEPEIVNTGILGIHLNYENNSFESTDDATGATSAVFDEYAMYGGRRRCMVDNEGKIYAFNGDSKYTEDPTSGYQIMVYQPKFYYKRLISKASTINTGIAIREENIKISSVAQPGFKLHPLFIDENGKEIDYVLLSAYEGSIESEDGINYQDRGYTNFVNQKLSSVKDAKPISGAYNNLTLDNIESLARNRGIGWHVLNIQAISAEQMLLTVEGQMNGQNNLDMGITSAPSHSSTAACTATTGATSSLGNSTGRAETTSFTYDNNTYVETTEGKVSFTYRGVENPWGNAWQLIQGIKIMHSSGRHIPQVQANSSSNNYNSLNFSLSTSSAWVTALGYDSNYDWVFIPIETASNGSSLGLIGDSQWSTTASSGEQMCLYGGGWYSGYSAGPFFYAWDRKTTENGGRTVNGRIMHIPNKQSSIYTENINKWKQEMGG